MKQADPVHVDVLNLVIGHVPHGDDGRLLRVQPYDLETGPPRAVQFFVDFGGRVWVVDQNFIPWGEGFLLGLPVVVLRVGGPRRLIVCPDHVPGFDKGLEHGSHHIVLRKRLQGVSGKPRFLQASEVKGAKIRAAIKRRIMCPL